MESGFPRTWNSCSAFSAVHKYFIIQDLKNFFTMFSCGLQCVIYHLCLNLSLIISLLLVSLPNTSSFTRSHSQLSTLVKRARGTFSIAQHLKETFIVVLFSMFLLSFHPMPHSPAFYIFFFVLWDFFLFFGLPSSKIGFLSCFSYTFIVDENVVGGAFHSAPCRPPLRPNAFVHTHQSGLFEDNIIQNTSRLVVPLNH